MHEFTLTNFQSDNGEDFVAIQLIKDWGREGEEGKQSPLLSDKVSKMAASNRGHNKVYNCIQCLYIETDSQVTSMD